MSGNGHVPSEPSKATTPNWPSDPNAEVIYNQPKIFTVEQAIPYSPFSSIVPFDSDIVPIPSIGLRSSNSIFKGSHQREETRHGLENLNREASDPKYVSENLLRNLNYIRELLHPAGITRYKFKHRPKPFSGPEELGEPQISLSAFPQTIFDSTLLSFANSVPEPFPRTQIGSDTLRSASSTNLTHQPLSLSQKCNYQQNLSLTNGDDVKPPDVTLRPKPESKIQEKFEKSTLSPKYKFCESETTGLLTINPEKSLIKSNHEVISGSSISMPQAVVTKNSPSLLIAPATISKYHSQGTGELSVDSREIVLENKNDIKLEDENISKPTKSLAEPSSALLRLEIESSRDILARGCDEREKADIALQNLHKYLEDILEAQDQPRTDNGSQFIINTPDGGVGLTNSTHLKLDSLLQKVVRVGRFSHVEVSDLLRVQRLCESSLKDTETLDLKIYESMAEEDVKLWSLRLTSAQHGIRSAHTALQIMAGGREERQIYSEDLTQSALNALNNVIETCVIPIVEIRNYGNCKILFKLLSVEKKPIISLLKQCQRFLLLLAVLVVDIDLSDTVVNGLECMVFKLFFVENASTEKDSIVGISRFDGLRTAAMEVLSGIFTAKPAQRRGIFAEFLTSLEKLPISKQNARQFKLSDGSNIQHASALIMRLIQTSTIRSDFKKDNRRAQALENTNLSNIAKNDLTAPMMDPELELVTNEKQSCISEINYLKAIVSPLLKAAKSDATYVIEFIVARATITTKGVESPFRHLLDLFVQDFITCLNSIDWPAAELLLRFLLFKMIEISKSPKNSSISRNTALDILSQMGPKISELHYYAQKIVKSVEYCQSESGANLTNIAELYFEKKVSDNQTWKFDSEILSWTRGPFRICLESLEDRISEKLMLRPTIAFIKIDWANRLLESFDHFKNENEPVEKDYADLAYKIQEIIQDDNLLSRENGFANKSTSPEIRLAHTLILLASPFCQYLDHILSIFLASMNSGQAMVQAKSLKCLTQLLDTDPGIIDRHPWVKDQMIARLEDVSSSVRENALGLISKLISLQPSLEIDMVPEVLKRLSDANVSVRKRAIRLVKEIYVRNYTYHVRVKIARKILWKTDDDEPSIQELARQILEEIWFSPLHQSAANNHISPKFNQDRAELVSLIVETTETPEKTMDKLLAERLDKVLSYILSSKSKSYEANTTVFKALVDSMFETVIDNSSGTSSSAHSRIGCFHILQVFATSKPELFKTEHIQILHPYVANLSGTDNAAIYNSVVNIFKQTLPHLPGIHKSLLISIRNDLLKSLARLRVSQLDDVIACMSIISKTLQNFDNLTRVLLSGLETINKLKRSELKDDVLKKLLKLLPIVGLLGKHCDFECRRVELSEKFPMLQQDTVPRLITEIIAPLASRSYPLELRKAALQAVGYVCFSWPQNFSYVNVYTILEQAFDEKESELQTVVLEVFKSYLIVEEKRSECEEKNAVQKTPESTAKLGVIGGSQGDGIALGIAHRFLSSIISVGLSSKDEKLTLLSTEIIASVARQGLVHPKQPGVALITLETTPFNKIAKIAFEEHIALHAKHETLFERDYMTAVQSSYDYQRDIVDNTRGAWVDHGSDTSGTNYISKLSRMVQILNDLSKLRTRKKFYENICLQLDRNKPRKDATEKHLVPREEVDHIKFSQYVIENIAFFEYKTFDELNSILHIMEKFFSSVGTDIAHNIEKELENRPLEHALLSNGNTGELDNAYKAVNVVYLRQLTAASIPLLLLWEARSYLRQQYNVIANKREGKVKALKDPTVKPSKVNGVNGDSFWRESGLIARALESESTMIAQCRKFVEILNFDHELKVAVAENNEDIESRVTPEIDDDRSISSTPRASGTVHNRKRKFVNDTTSPYHKKHNRSKSSRKTNSLAGSDTDF